MKFATPTPLQSLLLILALLLGLAWATPAGTVIRNQAVAMVGGQIYLSNEIETVVQAVCIPSLTPNGTPGTPAQHAVVPAGGLAYFTYLLRNSGNDTFAFSLGWIQDSAPWTPSSVRLYHDSNHNAQLDPGEVELSSVTLASGQEIRLILEVRTPASASGDLHISPVATCPGGTHDDNNYSRVSIGSGAALSLVKSVSAPEVREGEEILFSIRVRNQGNAQDPGPIYVMDMLNTPELQGLSYLAGSASATKGQLEYSGGDTWSPSEPQAVRGIRLVLGTLASGEEAIFSFRMRVETGALPGPRWNLATAQSASSSAQSSASLRILGRYAHALGPRGNPLAAGAADRQSALVPPGQPYCFKHTLLNRGNTADSYTLEAVGLLSGLHLSYQLPAGSLPSPIYLPAGASLPSPIYLPAGASLDFSVCLPGLPAGTPPFELTLRARSMATGQTDPTVNRVEVLDFSQIQLVKVSTVGPVVSPGERVVYTLRIHNPLSSALTNLEVEDVLDPSLDFVSASHGGVYLPASRTVRWSLPSLGAESTLTLNLEVRIAASTPQDALIPNRFSLRAQGIENPLFSNTLTLRNQTAALLLEKRVQPTKVSAGDLLTYTLTVVNVGQVSLTVRLEDTPDAGLAYVPGSANPSEPLLQGGVLVWNNLTLAPGDAPLELSYKMRLLAGAGPALRNTARAIGQTASGSAVASAVASAVVQVGGVFTPPRILAGRVYLDADRDGRYTAGVDLPLPGARVLLSNGLQTLTDAEGRYSFRDLAGGLWEVLLDPSSAPFQPLPHPEALGDGYRHRVRVEGLTISDFPLALPLGSARAVRETSLQFGPLKVEKKLLPLPAGLRVVLVLSSSETLNDLTLTDPLPGGGEQIFRFEQYQGTQTLTYDLPGGFLTDPQVRWRYP